ncbi:MAG TPA: SDR family oxidoreductase [Pirellulaceae bacterium]|jgi:NAD(P)-dependent dehydrogenase (short-subunit alcohol dehydrogenase family)
MQRNVLVTGGVSGIGRAIAEAFATDGCRVTVTAKTREEVEQAQLFRENVQAYALDNSKPLEIDQVIATLDRLDVLVNAAGMILRDGQEFDAENFERVVDVNLTGTMRMCLAARELLFASRGSIINIASMLAFFGSGYAPAYSASKGGVSQLTKSLAIAWAPHGVRVNAIAPGWIETALTAPLVADPTKSDTIVSRTPLGRWGQPSDIAGAALFLASPAAAFVTGVVLPVDGGYSVC